MDEISGVNLDVYQNIDEKRTKLGTVVIVISEASNTLPEAVGDSNYVDLSDYNNDYEEGGFFTVTVTFPTTVVFFLYFSFTVKTAFPSANVFTTILVAR